MEAIGAITGPVIFTLTLDFNVVIFISLIFSNNLLRYPSEPPYASTHAQGSENGHLLAAATPS